MKYCAVSRLHRPRAIAQPHEYQRHNSGAGRFWYWSSRGCRVRYCLPIKRCRSTAFLYALPYQLYRRHRIRAMVFHGTSHRYVAYRYRQLREITREETNVITLHLGKRVFDCCHSSRRLGGHVMGLDAARGSGDGYPVRRHRSSYCRFSWRLRRALTAQNVETLLNKPVWLLGISD
jgi:acetate kinase